MAGMQDEGRDLLARCRGGSATWAEAACGEAIDDEGRWTDPNAARRYALLLALQYDLRAPDRALVRYLFEQEALRHRREPLQGLFPALRLGGYLLATFRAVEHVWLFAEAKLANFDTFLGFDREHLVSASIEETLAYVHAASVHPLREQVLEWLVRADGRYLVSEEDLAAWWHLMVANYPARQADEDPMARLEQALVLGDVVEARRWLEAWEATLPRTPDRLSTLAWYWEQLRDWDRAGTVAAEYLAHDGLDAEDRASMQVHAATYHRKAGRAAEAGRQLMAARDTLAGIERWWDIGFGRMAMEEALLLAQASPAGDEGARAAYRWAAEQLARRGAASLQLLQLAEAAAAHLGDDEGRALYGRRAQRERRRLDRERRNVR